MISSAVRRGATDAGAARWASLFAGLVLCACQSGCSGLPGSIPTSPTRLTVVSVDADPVLEPGEPGRWDDTDVLNPALVHFGGVLYNHYSGYSAAIGWSTGTAASRDHGVTWTKSPEPFLVSPTVSARVPDPIAANGTSVEFGGRLHHLFVRSRSADDSNVSIWLTTSPDGQTWDAPREVFVASGVAGAFDELQVADPFVVKVGDTLYLYYTGAPVGSFRIMLGVATSKDAVHWTRVAGPLLPQGAPGMFDEWIQGEPAVIRTRRGWYMLYVGDTNKAYRSLGWAASTDGLHWTRRTFAESIVPATMRQPWFANMMIDPDIDPVPNDDGTFNVYFGGGTNIGNQRISGRIGRMRVRLE